MPFLPGGIAAQLLLFLALRMKSGYMDLVWISS